MSRAPVTVFVCVTCRVAISGGEGQFKKPGIAFAEALKHGVAEAGAAHITVRPVECLSVCKRPCTIAFTSPGKWTYILGDIDPRINPAEILAAAESYAAAKDGIVPWNERAAFFKKGVAARVPPATYRMTEDAK